MSKQSEREKFFDFVRHAYQAVPSFISIDEADAAIVKEARRLAGVDVGAKRDELAEMLELHR